MFLHMMAFKSAAKIHKYFVKSNKMASIFVFYKK